MRITPIKPVLATTLRNEKEKPEFASVYVKKRPSRIKVKPLTKHFTIRGLIYDQLMRNDIAAIYSVTHGISKRICGYETIIIQWHNGLTFPGGITAPASEFYPSTASFGVKGWYFGPEDDTEWAFEKAKRRFKAIVEKEDA
jgi:hypothetical protein